MINVNRCVSYYTGSSVQFCRQRKLYAGERQLSSCTQCAVLWTVKTKDILLFRLNFSSNLILECFEIMLSLMCSFFKMLSRLPTYFLKMALQGVYIQLPNIFVSKETLTTKSFSSYAALPPSSLF